MNFNYDLITWMEYFFGSFICCFGIFISVKILLEVKMKEIKWFNYLLLFIFSVFIVFNSLLFDDSIANIFGSLLIFFLIPKWIFKQNISKSFIYSIITYIIFVISDLSLTLILSLLMLIFNFSNAQEIVKTILGNIIVIVFVYLYILKLKRYINKKVEKVNLHNIVYVFILGIITIFILISSMYNLYLNNWIIDYKFVINIVVFIGCLILAIVLFKQYLENKEMTDKYKLLNDYLKTSAELIEKYSSTVHKYKNNLIAIKGYIQSDNKKADNYINTLLETYNSKKYNWFNKINNIQLDALRYLIYYKLSKAENNNLNIIVDVSKDIKKYNNDLLTTSYSNALLDIVGELFDNAIYASNESNEKELNVSMFEDKNDINILISNTFIGEIDLLLITKNGYTTKGTGHGLGLYDIDKTIKKNNIFKIKYEIFDNYFIVTLTISIKK